eukprot:Rhum_TRINITY_DN14929_c0_g2::Rhum_TRINITY_DN14929_c0_g2_i1::g.128386::m.128386
MRTGEKRKNNPIKSPREQGCDFITTFYESSGVCSRYACFVCGSSQRPFEALLHERNGLLQRLPHRRLHSLPRAVRRPVLDVTARHEPVRLLLEPRAPVLAREPRLDLRVQGAVRVVERRVAAGLSVAGGLQQPRRRHRVAQLCGVPTEDILQHQRRVRRDTRHDRHRQPRLLHVERKPRPEAVADQRHALHPALFVLLHHSLHDGHKRLGVPLRLHLRKEVWQPCVEVEVRREGVPVGATLERRHHLRDGEEQVVLRRQRVDDRPEAAAVPAPHVGAHKHQRVALDTGFVHIRTADLRLPALVLVAGREVAYGAGRAARHFAGKVVLLSFNEVQIL